ncbi:hypothetical protein N7540_004946 [Penicillium herquei]|nr:hypothetical protein N7540_004946 [Penicillium herquei]
MSEYLLYSEPRSTSNLLQRWPSAQGKEKAALRALISCMVDIFQDNAMSSLMIEAAKLSSVVEPNDYPVLLRTFANELIKGRTDKTVIDSKVLRCFAFIIRQASDASHVGLVAVLVPVLRSLTARLDDAKENSQPETQHQLVCTLAVILDAMGDIGINDLSRENIHEPLRQSLKVLQDNKEPRLAQSASYAYQALVGISNDESTAAAVWRNASDIIIPLAKIAGAIPSFDPSKFVDATPQVMQLLSSISSLVKSAQTIVDESQSLQDTAKNMSILFQQKDWYGALRYTDLLITAKAFKMLESFLQHNPSKAADQFWCGIFAQLERSWYAEKDTHKAITDLISGVLPQIDHKRRLVWMWISMLAEIFDQPDWKGLAKPQSKLRFLKKNTKVDLRFTAFFSIEITGLEDKSQLLDAALPNCFEAVEFYADNELAKVYKKSHLEIRRLSGELLDIDQCYINLAIVEISSERKATSKDIGLSSAFTLSKRSLVTSTTSDKMIALPSLFDKREVNGKTTQPRRILIHGRAGVGKSTLCKKIVHDFICGELWSELFDRIIWLPLRDLKEKPTLQELLDSYLQNSSSRLDRKRLVAALQKLVDSSDSNSRTLLLLDGLDEVPPESTSRAAVRNLLNHHSVIITSRPHAVNFNGLDPVDLELETMGFRDEEIQSYLSKVVEDENKRYAIKVFIDEHWLIQGLVRIPIQLDAICYSWDDDFLSDGTATMTALYQEIEVRLWKKDLLQLGKIHQGQKLLNRSQLEIYGKNEMAFLELLAFAGLTSDVIVFNQKHREEIYKHSGSVGMSDDILDKLSFLRTSDSSKRNISTYHFLHLTFQEYFAARYFTRCWIYGKALSCQTLNFSGNSSPEYLSPERFLQNEKYTGRYDVFWRFVTGLLCSESEIQVCVLLQRMKEEPHDLFGLAHITLLVHCLSEIPTSIGGCREEIEGLCSQWPWFEINGLKLKIVYESFMLDEEFPCEVLGQIVKQKKPWRSTAFIALGDRTHVRDTVQQSILSILRQENISEDEQIKTIRALGKNKNSSEETRRILRTLCLESSSDQVQVSSFIALRKQATISEKDLDIAIHLLEKCGRYSAGHAFGYLSKLSPMPEKVFEKLTLSLKAYLESDLKSHLGDPDLGESLGKAAGEFLSSYWFSFYESAMNVQEYLLQSIKDAGLSVKIWWISLLRDQRILTKDAIGTLTSLMIGNENHHVRAKVVEILSFQQLEEDTINALVAQMKKDPSSMVQHNIALIILRQGLSSTTVDALVSQLIETVDNFTCPAIMALSNCTLLPDRAIDALVRRITNETELDERFDAAQLFQKQTSLPDGALDTMIALITKTRFSPTYDVRNAAFYAIINRPLPDWAVDALILTMTMEPDEKLHGFFMSAVACIPHFSDKAFEAISHLITMEPQRYYYLAYRLLREGRSTPERIQDSLVSSLDKTQDWNDDYPILALKESTYFPQDAIEAFLYQLEEREPSDSVKRTIVSALWKHSIHSLFTSSKILRTVYHNLAQDYTSQKLILYIQDGLFHVISSGVKKKFTPAMDVEEIKSLLFEEGAKVGNPLIKYYNYQRRPEDQNSL